MQLVNKRNLIIGGVIVVLILFIGTLFALQQSRNSSNGTDANIGKDTQTVDKNSDTTVSEIEGKDAETWGVLPNAPSYLNVEEFIERGMSTEQLDSLKYAFYMYTSAQNPKIKQVSITKDSVVATAPDASGKLSMTFNVVFDSGEKMQGSLVYYDNSSVELTLANSAGQKVFESGTQTDKSIYLQQ